MDGMSGADMSGMHHDMGAPMTGLFGSYPMTRDASGTSWQPDAAPHEGLHATLDGWELMGHAAFDLVFDSQSGPRGDTQWFVQGMMMGAARHTLGEGDTLNLRLMLSPDALMGRRGYPLLLASGETLIDRQHPHDLVMELAGSYTHVFSSDDSAFLYLGYPGEPALGPPAFLHRASGMDIPEAPAAHHWLDSTHITFGVATLGVVHDDWKVEVSRFTGREPDQDRFGFDTARFDSTAARLTWNPSAHWSLQASWGFLKSPEELAPSLNETRLTASAEYVDGPFAATLAFGHKQLSDGTGLNAWLLEGEYKPDADWTVFARAETVENDELFASGTVETADKLSLGLIRDWRVGAHALVGLGGLYDFDIAPAGSPSYGGGPHGAMLFLRLRAG